MDDSYATNMVGIALNTLCSLLGGFLIPLHYLIQRIRSGESLPGFRSRTLWLPFLIYPIPGVVICLVYQLGAIDLSPIVSLNLGLTGPALIASRVTAEESSSGGGQA